MDTAAILEQIRSEWQKRVDSDSRIRDTLTRIQSGKATYAEAQDIAIRTGDILSDVFRKYLPEALVDGRLYEETANALIRKPMLDDYRYVADQAEAVQRSLNQAADIGIAPVVPEANDDQIDGIIQGISSARDYYHYEESFLDQVENFSEGVVDDFVRENADFQYKAGLTPTIERKTDGKCCPWCSRLAGTYLYEDVSNRGNDVFRRHRNCHCQVLFNPGDGSKRRQNVYTRAWVIQTKESKDRRLRLGEIEEFKHGGRNVQAQKINKFARNNLYCCTDIKLSKKELRDIDRQITIAKHKHGLEGKCNSPIVVVNDSRPQWLASYNPTDDVFFISRKMANIQDIRRIQADYTCSDNPCSTMVHELFHWVDADGYKREHGSITSRSYSEYSQYMNRMCEEKLEQEHANDVVEMRKVSRYATISYLANDYEEAYTEYRTMRMLQRRRIGE